MKSAVVLSIDRLGAGYLGPYGNTWIDTPSFNRLASRSLLFETAIAESPELASAFCSYLTGTHALAQPRCGIASADLLRARWGESDCRTMLIADEPEVLGHPLAAAFDERAPVDATEATSAADDESETSLARLFAVACERLAALEGTSLLWIHSRGMGGPWDAPYALRCQFADEDDPEPPAFVAPPSLELPESFDPDELLGCQQAYAGQVLLTDLCLGALIDALDASPAAEEALLIVTSPRGFPLGEHGAIGGCGDRLFGEVLHVPLLVRLPHGAHASRRSHALVQPADLCATLAAWLDIGGFQQSVFGRDLLAALDGDHDVGGLRQAVCSTATTRGVEHSIRTPAWFLRRADDGVQLYAKPDDRWEVNEVSNRCAEVAEQLTAALEERAEAIESGSDADAGLLPAVLVEGLQ